MSVDMAENQAKNYGKTLAISVPSSMEPKSYMKQMMIQVVIIRTMETSFYLQNTSELYAYEPD